MENTNTMERLTASKLKAWREAQWEAQGRRCALTGYPLALTDAVADHDHETGHIRGVIHRGVNSLLGKLENGYRRYGVSRPMMYAMGTGLRSYLERDHRVNPIYPTHKTPDEKRLVRNAKARADRAKKKELS